MIDKNLVYLIAACLIAVGCKNENAKVHNTKTESLRPQTSYSTTNKLDTSSWIEVFERPGQLILDLKYATTDNFTQTQLYDCPRCFMRKSAAQALYSVVAELNKRGYIVKLFDCYRPRKAHQKLWDTRPDQNYLSNPWQVSMNTRGAAVDLTLCDEDGNELDMGSPFDHFGKESYHDNFSFAPEVNERKTILREVCGKYGFAAVRTRWWHYNYRGEPSLASNYVWDCE